MDIFRQRDAMDCGPACLVMICSHYGCRFPIERVRELCHITRTGVSLLGISEAAETLGLRTQGISCSLDSLLEVELPIILYWQQRHFVVLYKIEKKRGKYIYHIADPALGDAFDLLRNTYTVGTQGDNLIGLRVDGDIGCKRLSALGCYLNGFAEIAGCE